VSIIWEIVIPNTGIFLVKNKMKSRKGFTLVELLVVVFILGALAVIAIPRFVLASNTAKINACETNIDIINTQFEIYHTETGAWPNSITWLVVQHPEYFPDGTPKCPFGVDYTINPGTHRVVEHNH
jgi:prepilin-type N-terminal cleavage/methylation domain-containing protein